MARRRTSTESEVEVALQPDRVESIEVIKGPAATRLYDDARAEHGVIRITTKP